MQTARMLAAAVAAFAVCGVASAQTPKATNKKPAEPKCCKGKKCSHRYEKKHHTCVSSCHDEHQNKGICCVKHDGHTA